MFWTKVSNVFGPTWMESAEGTPSERMGYLKRQTRRAERSVHGDLPPGARRVRLPPRRKLSKWDPESDHLDVLEALGPDQINYVARMNDAEDRSQLAGRHDESEPDYGRYVFNNVADSVTKTYKVLCGIAGVPAVDPVAGQFDDVPEAELEEVN